MRRIKQLLLSFVFVFCLVACSKQSNINRDYIMQNFTKEEIVFFWESACFNDSEGKNGRFIDSTFLILRWAEDIHVKTFGDLSQKDTLALYDAISQINEVGLPIKIIWAADTAKHCNLEMYFGRKKDINKMFSTNSNAEAPRDSFAFGELFKNDRGHIYMVRVGIYNDSIYTENASTISHELLNALGLQGDPFSDLSGVLYDNKLRHTQTTFSDIEKNALRLLYSPAIRAGTSRQEFFDLFQDMLPTREVSAKDYDDFENYIKQKCYSLETIEEFLAMSFLQSVDIRYFHISKWKTKPVISFESDSVERMYKPQIDNVINQINKYGEKQYPIEFSSKGSLCNIEIATKGDNTVLEAVGQSGVQLTFAKIVFPSHTKSSDRSIKQYDENTILQVLTGIGGTDQFPLQSGHIVRYSPEYLQLFLSPFVKSGMERDRIVRILKKHYNLSSRWQTPNYDLLERYLAKKSLSDSAICYIKHCLSIVPLENVSRTEKLNIYLGGTMSKNAHLIETIKESFSSYIDIDISSKNQSNLAIDYFAGNYINIKTFFNSAGIKYSNIEIPREYKGSVLLEKTANIILTDIFPDSNNQGIVRLKNEKLILNPYWEEALQFYYSKYIQASMERKKVIEMIEKYYPG